VRRRNPSCRNGDNATGGGADRYNPAVVIVIRVRNASTDKPRGAAFPGSTQEQAMKLRRLYRLVLTAAAGGMVFQTATSCSDLAASSLTAMLPSLTSALTSAITDATQCDTAPTSGSAITPTDSTFTAVGNAIEGVRSNLGLPGGGSSGAGSSGASQ